MQSVTNTRRTVELPSLLWEILPRHLADAAERCGAWRIEEIRLHSDRIATVTCSGHNYSTGILLRPDEMTAILKNMCGGSLYAYSHTINQGYLSLPGGIRVGICGSAAIEKGQVIGVNDVSGLILRLPHPPTVSAEPLIRLLREMKGLGGALIYAPPGVGKTTLLRAAAICAASGTHSIRTVVVDTREELSTALSGSSLTLDVLIGYPREIGIEIAVRSLGAELVICDEIGGIKDATAILHAANCGVPLLASAHADSISTLLHRPSITMLHRARVFGAYVGITRSPSEGFSLQITRWEEISL
jgi:stage III sporulation protein AA